VNGQPVIRNSATPNLISLIVVTPGYGDLRGAGASTSRRRWPRRASG
jgi:hypothetical protein